MKFFQGEWNQPGLGGEATSLAKGAWIGVGRWTRTGQILLTGDLSESRSGHWRIAQSRRATRRTGLLELSSTSVRCPFAHPNGRQGTVSLFMGVEDSSSHLPSD